MSYLTRIDFKVTGNHAEAVRRAVNEIRERYYADTDEENGGWFDINNGNYDEKFRSFFIELSKRYPNVLIHLDGNGENDDDFWQARFLNGKHEYSIATLTYEPFMEILTDEEKEQQTADEENFAIGSVSREDLEDAGFNAATITAEQMKRLAARMEDDYRDNHFHESLINVAEFLGIPRKDN